MCDVALGLMDEDSHRLLPRLLSFPRDEVEVLGGEATQHRLQNQTVTSEHDELLGELEALSQVELDEEQPSQAEAIPESHDRETLRGIKERIASAAHLLGF